MKNQELGKCPVLFWCVIYHMLPCLEKETSNFPEVTLVFSCFPDLLLGKWLITSVAILAAFSSRWTFGTFGLAPPFNLAAFSASACWKVRVFFWILLYVVSGYHSQPIQKVFTFSIRLFIMKTLLALNWLSYSDFVRCKFHKIEVFHAEPPSTMSTSQSSIGIGFVRVCSTIGYTRIYNAILTIFKIWRE